MNKINFQFFFLFFLFIFSCKHQVLNKDVKTLNTVLTRLKNNEQLTQKEKTNFNSLLKKTKEKKLNTYSNKNKFIYFYNDGTITLYQSIFAILSKNNPNQQKKMTQEKNNQIIKNSIKQSMLAYQECFRILENNPVKIKSNQFLALQKNSEITTYLFKLLMLSSENQQKKENQDSSSKDEKKKHQEQQQKQNGNKNENQQNNKNQNNQQQKQNNKNKSENKRLSQKMMDQLKDQNKINQSKQEQSTEDLKETKKEISPELLKALENEILRKEKENTEIIQMEGSTNVEKDW